MAQPTVVPISRVRGDTTRIVFLIKDADGVVKDLTGYTTFLLAVDTNETPEDELTQLFQLTGTAAVPANGKITFLINATQADQEPSTYFYDAQFTDNNGEIKTFAKGEWEVTQDIVKD